MISRGSGFILQCLNLDEVLLLMERLMLLALVKLVIVTLVLNAPKIYVK